MRLVRKAILTITSLGNIRLICTVYNGITARLEHDNAQAWIAGIRHRMETFYTDRYSTIFNEDIEEPANLIEQTPRRRRSHAAQMRGATDRSPHQSAAAARRSWFTYHRNAGAALDTHCRQQPSPRRT